MVPPEVLHDEETAIFQAAIEEIGPKTGYYTDNNSYDQNFLKIRSYVFSHPDDTCLKYNTGKELFNYLVWSDIDTMGREGYCLQSTGLRNKTDNILEHNRARGLAGL